MLPARHLVAWVQVPCVPQNYSPVAILRHTEVPLAEWLQNPTNFLVNYFRCYILRMEEQADRLRRSVFPGITE